MTDPIERMYAEAFAPEPEAGELVETYLASWNADGELREWFVDMTYEQARDVERKLEEALFTDISVERPGKSVSFETFMADAFDERPCTICGHMAEADHEGGDCEYCSDAAQLGQYAPCQTRDRQAVTTGA